MVSRNCSYMSLLPASAASFNEHFLLSFVYASLATASCLCRLDDSELPRVARRHSV
ncbi:hypothetical protein M3J09_003778 [Ascochyta lentis]